MASLRGSVASRCQLSVSWSCSDVISLSCIEVSFLRVRLQGSYDIIAIMASILIRKVDETTKKRLRVRAATHGRSMEEEARAILKKALSEPKPIKRVGIGTAIKELFAPLGGITLPEVPREPIPEPPDFSK